VAALIEGNSIRATVRMTGVAKNTVTKLLVDLGTVCSVYQDRAMRDLTCQRLERGEIWALVGAKAKSVKPERREQGWGDIWTWVALDADTKLVPSYRIGARDLREAKAFMTDLAARLRHRVQPTTATTPTCSLSMAHSMARCTGGGWPRLSRRGRNRYASRLAIRSKSGLNSNWPRTVRSNNSRSA
jgi:hypothetical protein